MKQAVGTSLLIIAAKSLIGFTGDVSENAANMDWLLLSIVTGLAIVGIFIGNQLSKKVDGAALKKGFGWFVFVIGNLYHHQRTCFSWSECTLVNFQPAIPQI